MTNWKEFKKITKKMIIRLMKGKIIIDPLGILSHLELENLGFKYFVKGKKNLNEF